MSLATTGGGLGGAHGGAGGAGGLVMAHQANSVGQGAAPQPPPQAQTISGAPPPSMSALAADLVDKTQGLSLKTARNLAHLPIVAIDLHSSEGKIAFFPKKPEDPSKGVLPVSLPGKISTTTVRFQSNNETAQKTLRKYLSNSKTYSSLKTDSLATENAKLKTVTIDKPHCWLGLRRYQDAPDFIQSTVNIEKDDEVGTTTTAAIAEETSQGVGVVISNSTLDCSSVPNNDDFDRVVYKVRLHESKKAVSVLPEEAVQMVIRQAQYKTAAHLQTNDDEEDEDEIVDYPVAIALPTWAFHDAAIEALMDATGSSGVIFQRNVAATVGALLPSLDGNITPLFDRLNKVRAALHKQFQLRLVKEPDAIFEDDVTVLVFGMTAEGFEATAIQISSPNLSNISCLFSILKVISNVSYQSADPISLMEKCAKELEANMDAIAGDADGPSAVVLCGSAAEQKQMQSHWGKIKNEEWKKVPVFPTDPTCITKGAAVLGGVSHGRLSKIDHSHGKKARAELAMKVQNVAPVAVAVQMNYHGGAANKWTPVKTLFDFDRQIPAGPHGFDFNAAECAVYREGKKDLSDEEFEKATKQYEGAKGIPVREEAALNFQVQVLQKWTRDAEWKKVGDPMEPLVMKKEKEDSSEVEKVACESIKLEISLGTTGMITTNLVGERESVVQANTSARNSAIRTYVGILFAILFFGGFFFKSFWDDYVLRRDTERLLLYYKRVVPGSYHDGDEHGARYLCYKYRNKKAKLWKNLEKKYGEPVLETAEYQEMFANEPEENQGTEEEEEEEENLDEDNEEAPDL